MQYRTSRQDRAALENITPGRRTARRRTTVGPPDGEALYLVRLAGAHMGQPIYAVSADQAAARYRLLFGLPTTTALAVDTPGRPA